MFQATLKEILSAIVSPDSQANAPSSFDILTANRNVIFVGGTKFRLARIKAKILEVYQLYDEAKQEKLALVVQKHEETGEFIVNPATKDYIYNSREEKIATEKDLRILQEQVVEFEGEKLKRSELMYRDTKELAKAQKCALDLLSSDDVLNLLWLLDDSCFEEAPDADAKPAKRKAARA